MRVDRLTQIREGKAKILFETSSPEHIIQYFKDDATAFNALKKGQIKNKGVINNALSGWIFAYLEKRGVSTHFEERLSDREMLVKKVNILPIEMVIRNRAAGSIVKRLGIPKGTDFCPPLMEYFYKSDALGDPLISEAHIFHFGWATRSELDEMNAITRRVNDLLKDLFRHASLELIDFKLEFGRWRDTILLADEFTPDGCRLWDRETGESMDKDRFRQDLGRVDETYGEVFDRMEKTFRELAE